MPRIRDLLVETWHVTYDGIYGTQRVAEITDSWHSIASLERQLAIPQSEFIVADDGANILAVAFALAHGDHADLKQLYVLPQVQRRGIGAMLVDEIARSFEDADAIFLEVEIANIRAIGFYRSRGFVECGRGDECNGQPGFETMLMRKVL